MVKKKRTIKKWIAVVTGLGLLAGAMAGYGVFIEPNQMHVRTATWGDPAAGTEPITAVHFSDVHLGPVSLRRLQKLVDTINAQNPTIIFFTGDMVDKARNYHEAEQAAAILAGLQAPLGKFAVWGNHDVGGGGHRMYPALLETAGFTLLKNETEWIPLADGRILRVTGLDDAQMGRPDFSVADHAGAEDMHIVLAHAPDAAISLEGKPIDLVLSGHSHGGQIAIPFWGPLYTPPKAREYTHGTYQLSGFTLSIENGVGTTGVPVRFLSPPGFTVFTLYF